MRIVAGRYKGRNLVTPKGNAVRPTTTRIKETYFNILQWEVPDARVLDLFAGSGALGIECLSRGSASVTFVDKSKDSIRSINENLTRITGDYRVLNCDYLSFLNGAGVRGEQYDIIFLDPPYSTNLGYIAIEKIFELNLLSENGVILFEHSSSTPFILTDKRYKQRTKVMASVTAEFIRRRKIALMTGSFDPFTVGHEELLKRALNDFDEVVIACLNNEDKKYLFTMDERLKIVEEVCKDYDNVKALSSCGTAVEVFNEVNALKIVRGVRNKDDEAYEREMAKYNEERGAKTVIFKLDTMNDISSSLVREEIKKGNFSHIPESAVQLVSEYLKKSRKRKSC